MESKYVNDVKFNHWLLKKIVSAENFRYTFSDLWIFSVCNNLLSVEFTT